MDFLIDEAQQRCWTLLREHHHLLAGLAHDVLDQGLAAEDFAVFCLDTTHEEWSAAIATLVREHEFGFAGEGVPVVTGTLTTPDAVVAFGDLMPQITAALEQREQDGFIRVVVIRGSEAFLFFQEIDEQIELDLN